MEPVGVRAGIAGYLRNSNFKEQENTKSASLAEAGRHVKILEEENHQLKKELLEIKIAYRQLVEESSHEKFDERRVNLLKSQLIQSERQILILNEALSARSGILLEIENGLEAIADCLRVYLGKGERIGEVTLSKSDVIQMVETAESSRIKIFKHHENTRPENMERPLHFMGKFVQQRQSQPVTILDVCRGKLDHINLKHVGKLESKLSQVYQQLILLHQTLYIIHPGDRKPANQQLPKKVYTKLGSQITHACNLLHDVNVELLDLSLLCPSAPWAPLKGKALKEITTESVMSKFPSLSKGKEHEIKEIVEALVKAIHYTTHMTAIQNKAARHELTFHQKVYRLQLDYIDSLFQALQESYLSFQESTNQLICRPMKNILKYYRILEKTASEDALKKFLSTFKSNAPHVEDAVEKLLSGEKDEQEAFSIYGRQFFESIHALEKEHQAKRDYFVEQLNVGKEMKKTAIETLGNKLDVSLSLKGEECEVSFETDFHLSSGGFQYGGNQLVTNDRSGSCDQVNESNSSRSMKQHERNEPVDEVPGRGIITSLNSNKRPEWMDKWSDHFSDPETQENEKQADTGSRRCDGLEENAPIHVPPENDLWTSGVDENKMKQKREARPEWMENWSVSPEDVKPKTAAPKGEKRMKQKSLKDRPKWQDEWATYPDANTDDKDGLIETTSRKSKGTTLIQTPEQSEWCLNENMQQNVNEGHFQNNDNFVNNKKMKPKRRDLPKHRVTKLVLKPDSSSSVAEGDQPFDNLKSQSTAASSSRKQSVRNSESSPSWNS